MNETLFLPKDSQTYLNIFKFWVLPVIELGILTFIILNIRKSVKRYKQLKDKSPDFFTSLKTVCREMLPQRVAMLFVMEVSVVYYGFINWKKRLTEENEFTYHKKSGTPALFGALIFAVGIETTAVHFLVERWNPTVAWILTGIGIYTALQVFGFAKSLSQRPISIDPNSLGLKYGILNEVDIPYEDIVNIELTRKPIELDKLTRKITPFSNLEHHNVIIYLNKVNVLTGLYGIKRKFKTLALHIDEAEKFKIETDKYITNNTI